LASTAGHCALRQTQFQAEVPDPCNLVSGPARGCSSPSSGTGVAAPVVRPRQESSAVLQCPVLRSVGPARSPASSQRCGERVVTGVRRRTQSVRPVPARGGPRLRYVRLERTRPCFPAGARIRYAPPSTAGLPSRADLVRNLRAAKDFLRPRPPSCSNAVVQVVPANEGRRPPGPHCLVLNKLGEPQGRWCCPRAFAPPVEEEATPTIAGAQVDLHDCIPQRLHHGITACRHAGRPPPGLPARAPPPGA
jgi:hypothetical protein